MVTLYTSGCFNCKRLEKRLDDAGVVYGISNDTDRLKSLGFDTVPVLQVDDKYMAFKEAIEWVKGVENV